MIATGISQYAPYQTYGRYYRGFRTPKTVRLITAWGTLLSLTFLLYQGVKATYYQLRPKTVAAESVKTIEKITYVDNKDRATKLKKYLELKKSPLAAYSDTIIKESDEHAIDWTLLVSIAGKESGFCQHIPSGSYNCWGIGGAGNMRYFNNYDHAIQYVAALLGTNYRHNIARGIQTKYCPDIECDGNWSSDVVNFSKEMIATQAN